MKNADKPAYPVRGATNAPFTASDSYEEYVKQCDPTVGFTKREMVAMAAMQGLISSHPDQAHNHGQGATVAVQWADALLKALEQ